MRSPRRVRPRAALLPIAALAALTALVPGLAVAADPAAPPATTELTITFGATAQAGDDRTRQVGPEGSVRYGTARIHGTGDASGLPVGVEVAGNLVYRAGSGPFTGAITVTWPNGDLLALAYDAVVHATEGGTAIHGTVTSLGGTGSLEAVTGAGIVEGGRAGELGSPTAYVVTVDLGGMPDPAILAAAPADPVAAVFRDPAASGAALFRAYGDLMIAKDLAALDALLDPAFLIARADGTFAGKEDYLARLPDVRGFTASDPTEARTDGGVTVRLIVAAELFVDGRMYRPDPVPQLAAFRWEGGRWRLVAQANFAVPAG